MRAKFIYEAFREDSDPVKDMGIGSKHVYYKLRKHGVFYAAGTYSVEDSYFMYLTGETYDIKHILVKHDFFWIPEEKRFRSNRGYPKRMWEDRAKKLFEEIENHGRIVEPLGKIKEFEKRNNDSFLIPGYEQWEFPDIPTGNDLKIYFKILMNQPPIIGVIGTGAYIGRKALKYSGYNFSKIKKAWIKIYEEGEDDELLEYFKERGYDVIDGRKNTQKNESFSEKSDPIKDMGIGFPFKIGSIVKRKIGLDVYPYDESKPYMLKIIKAEGLLNPTGSGANSNGIILDIKYTSDKKIYMEIIFAAGYSNFKWYLSKFKKFGKEKLMGGARIVYGEFNANEWKDMLEIVDYEPKRKDFMYEKFSEKGDPIQDMGIGAKTQILKDIEQIGLTEDNIYFKNDNTFFMKGGKRYAPNTFLNVQLKHFPFEKKTLLHDLEKTTKDVTLIIQQAINDKIKIEDIREIINYVFDNIDRFHPRYSNANADKNVAIIYLAKITRPKKQVKEEDESNIYVFIGYDDKVPVIIDGKKYYEDRFMAEKLVKIDKYNPADLAQVSAMQMRANMTDHGKVYIITVPKEFMDEESYDGIPEKNRYIIEKYKKRI